MTSGERRAVLGLAGVYGFRMLGLFLILPVLIPVPMMLFSIFTSVIQAYVFALLTVVYLSGAVQAHK